MRGRRSLDTPRARRRRASPCRARFLLLTLAVTLAGCGLDPRDGAAPVPGFLLLPSEAFTAAWNALFAGGEPRVREGGQLTRLRPLDPSPKVAHVAVPQHPFMAANPGSNMHDDASMSDTAQARGPLGVHPEIRSRSLGFGGYGTIAFDRARRIVGVYSNARSFRVELLDPRSLELLGSYPLPSRPWDWVLQGVMPWAYIGAGMYFYLDESDRAVVPTTENVVEVVQIPPAGSGGQLERVRSYDLSQHVVPLPWPGRDSVAWVLPEWSGERYWYATTAGMVGAVDVASGEVETYQLEGEVIENSFAVGPDGVFIVSDYALYRLSHDPQRGIVADWRTSYDRGSGTKPGHITRGSGTSVTLAGDVDGLVVVTDNAEPRIHLLFVRRSDGSLACSVPLFDDGRSGTDISAIAFEQADAEGRPSGRYSAIVENNWGHHRFPIAHPEGGLTRVDAQRRADGSYDCRPAWTSREKSIGVIKLSFASGLVYTYFRDESDPITQWYLSAIELESGQTAYRLRVGAGQGFNNWAGALFLDPDGDTLYTTTIFGLVMVRDRPPPAADGIPAPEPAAP